MICNPVVTVQEIQKNGDYNRKCMVINTTIDANGQVVFGNYIDSVEVIDTLDCCIALVYSNNSEEVDYQAVLKPIASTNSDIVTGRYGYITSSYMIEQTTANIYDSIENVVTWMINPDTTLAGRKVKVYLYEI